jgi:hypothetical protein
MGTVWIRRNFAKGDNLAEDRCELTDLADKHPSRVKAMAAEWEDWAKHVGVIWEGEESASTENDSLAWATGT